MKYGAFFKGNGSSFSPIQICRLRYYVYIGHIALAHCVSTHRKLDFGSRVCSSKEQKPHQTPHYFPSRPTYLWPVVSHKGPVTRKACPNHNVTFELLTLDICRVCENSLGDQPKMILWIFIELVYNVLYYIAKTHLPDVLWNFTVAFIYNTKYGWNFVQRQAIKALFAGALRSNILQIYCSGM